MPRRAYILGANFSWTDAVRANARLAYEDSGKLVIHDFPSGKRQEIDFKNGHHAVCVRAWSQDGRTIFQSFAGQVDAVDVESGSRRTVTHLSGGGPRSNVIWQLRCSPDGTRLLFLYHRDESEHPWFRIYSVATDGTDQREICSTEGLWNFACSWEHNVLLVSVAGKDRASLWRTDLEGHAPKRVLDCSLVRELEVHPDGERALYLLQSAVWSLDLNTGTPTRIVNEAKSHALAPDGKTIAFQRSEHDLYLQKVGEEPHLVVAGKEHDDTWRPFGWNRPPVWSADGRLLFFWSTTGKRFAESRDPEFVSALGKKKAVAERRKASGAPGAIEHDYDVSIEHTHWSFEHSVGVVDVEQQEVWMLRNARWGYAAWGPYP